MKAAAMLFAALSVGSAAAGPLRMRQQGGYCEANQDCAYGTICDLTQNECTPFSGDYRCQVTSDCPAAYSCDKVGYCQYNDDTPTSTLTSTSTSTLTSTSTSVSVTTVTHSIVPPPLTTTLPVSSSSSSSYSSIVPPPTSISSIHSTSAPSSSHPVSSASSTSSVHVLSTGGSERLAVPALGLAGIAVVAMLL